MADAMEICPTEPPCFSEEAVVLSVADYSATECRARLCASQESLSAIKGHLGDSWPSLVLKPRHDIRAEGVVLSELLSRRGPAAWVGTGASPEAAVTESTRALAQLAQDCRTRSTVLVLTSESNFDLVLVPREACGEDGVAFAVFTTRVEGVAFIARTISARQVPVVLDLDSTLVESEHLLTTPPDWHAMDWQTVGLTQQPSGVFVSGKICPLPAEPSAESVHAASWFWKGVAHNYRVRQRPGWSHLRDLLIQETREGGKLSAYVLSLGRPLYIQTVWQILDPAGQIIAPHEFERKVNSARPDGVYHVPDKTPCIGTGLRSIFAQDLNMHLGPVWCADDLPEVYTDKYRDSVYPVQPYRPVAGQPNQQHDDGSVLREMGTLLMQYWEHCYGAGGQGGAVAQVEAAASRTLHQLSAVPLFAQNGAANWCAGLFQSNGAGSALSVRTFIELQSTKLFASVREASTAQVDTELGMPENNENKLQAKPVGSATKLLAIPAERALRPSSRQDNVGASSSSTQQPSNVKLDVQQQLAAAEHATLLCAAGATPQQPGTALVEGSPAPQKEDSDGNGHLGRKRDFASIDGRDTLREPDAAVMAAADV